VPAINLIQSAIFPFCREIIHPNQFAALPLKIRSMLAEQIRLPMEDHQQLSWLLYRRKQRK
jgi:hypothetical protein